MTEKKIKTNISEIQEKRSFSERRKQSKFFSAKKKTIAQLTDLMQKNRTIMVASIENLPSKQFQKIKKTLKGKAIIKVLKKSLINLALENTGFELKLLQEKIDKNFAILLSQEDPFELAKILSELKTNSKIKPNQITEKEIIIPTGVTDIMAGSAITEFGNAKIKVGIEQGKIAIKESCLIPKDSLISPEISIVLERLEIKPVIIGIKPIIAYDSNNKKFYTNIKIDKDEALKMIALAVTQSMNLAIGSEFICKETISMLLSKANMQAQSLSNKLGGNQS